MDYGRIANSLLDALEQGIEDTPLLIALGQEYRKRGQWALATEMAVRYSKVADTDMAQDAEFWRFVYYMYLGGNRLAEGELHDAQGFFRAGERGFRRQQYLHGTMVALMAQGRICQIERKQTEAVRIYTKCERMCADLQQHAAHAHDFSRTQAYANLRTWLESAVVRLRETAFPRLVRELEVVAGEPTYLLADDDLCQTATVFLDGQQCHLLGCENGRTETECSLNPYDRYFVAHVRGDSMQGTTARQRRVDIHNGDRLLARSEDAWPPSETIGVFQEADRLPIVKILRRKADTVVLVSANPLYGDRIFDAHAPRLRYLGSVLAILGQTD